MNDLSIMLKKPSVVHIGSLSIDSDRIDGEFYNNKYIENNINLKNSELKIEILNNIIEAMNSPIGWQGISSNSYMPHGEGVPLIRVKNVNDLILDEDSLIGVEETIYKEQPAIQAQANDIIITRVGTIGRVCRIPEKIDRIAMGQNLTRIKLKETVVESGFMLAYMASKFCQLQMERYAYGGVQLSLTNKNIRQLLIPIPPSEIQKYIGDKVRKSEKLRKEAKKIKKEADEILNVEILDIQKQETIRNKGKWVNMQNVFIERLEPEYYEDRYLHAEQIIKKQKYQTLGNIIEKIQDGPGGWSISTNDYVDNGIPIVRGINIGNDGEFINSEFVYINTEKNKELKKTEVRPGQVLLTVRGTVGRATVMPNYIEKANLNAAVVKIKVKENIIDPYYLAGFFNSSIGRLQTSRIANGAVQLNMNLSECKTNLIPIPSMEIQQKYRMKFLEFLDAKDQSKQLIQEAKQDVEDLIEGNFDMSKLN